MRTDDSSIAPDLLPSIAPGPFDAPTVGSGRPASGRPGSGSGPGSDRRRRQADVVVIGAGMAGLAAAQRVAAAGRSVIVLEARADRVGGRVESAVHGGHAVDLGGAWIGAGHTRAAGLAGELSIPTWRTHHEGEPVVIHAGRRMRGRGYKLRHALATLEARRVSRRLEALAGRVSTNAPWASPGAAALDAVTLDSWLADTARLGGSHATLAGTLANLLGIEPRHVSLLHALFYLRSSGGMRAMLGEDGGAQQTLVEGGAQALATGLADGLGEGTVVTGAAVRRIEHGDCAGGGVRVTAAGGLTVEAGAAIVALSPALAARIAYEPALPVERDRLNAAMPHGDVTKVIALYPDAFWRRDGLSGEAWGAELPFSFSYDMSRPDGAPGVLTMFFVGDRAQRLRSLAPRERRALLVSALACCFGPAAARPDALLVRDWAAEPWSLGAYGGYMPPGLWTSHGHVLRDAVGPIAWAGSETAVDHSGYMEGALESAERAAAEALATLHGLTTH
jgi:monoamine oxidase